MAKYTVKDSDIIKITASTKLKVGDAIRTRLPINGSVQLYDAVVEAIKNSETSENFISIKVPIYAEWFDVGYVEEIL